MTDAFLDHVLTWVKEEIDSDAVRVAVVQGYGSDFAEGDTENGFYADTSIELVYLSTSRNAYASSSVREDGTYIISRELKGDDFQSLWSWVVGAWQVPEPEEERS